MPTKMYKQGPIDKYIDDLAAKLPAPGGGSAAALNASMGAALISMVVNFTLGKPKYAEYEKELKGILGKSENLKGEFLRLMDLDVIAYQSKNMRDALNVPFMLTRLCCEGLKLCPPLLKMGNKNLISDVAVAAIMLESAYACAYFNVIINLNTIADTKLTQVVEKELKQKDKIVKKIRKDVEDKVGKIIRG